VRNQLITVYEGPTANFSGSPLTGCFPLSIQFNDLSTAGAGNTNVTWEWNFGNGQTSTAQNPLIVYTTAGLFTVTLKVTNDKGCSRTISRPNYVSVTPGVTATFTNSQATVCRAPANITFTNNSTGPGTLSYVWDFGDGSPTSTLQNPVHTYTAPGTYTPVLTVTSSAGCSATFTGNPIVIGGFTTSFNGPSSACVFDPVTFTNTSTPVPGSTAWDFGDGGTASTLNGTHTYAAPGVYTVKVVNTYATCQDSAFQTITINPQPVAAFSAPVVSKCEPPLTVDFQDNSTGTPTGWEWDFGDGSPVSTQQNPSHTYTAYGSFTVRLIVTDGSGCKDTLTRTDYIVIRRASISITGLPARGCIPYTISPVPVISSVDAVTSYEWDWDDGSPFSTVANPTHTYPAQGTYNVRLVITTSSGCRDTTYGQVRVGSKPVADFTGSPNPVCARQPVNFTDLSVPADEWLWDFGDGGTSVVQNPTYIYTDTGLFTVRLIAYNNGCADTLERTNYIRVLPPIARYSYVANCNNRLEFTFTDQSVAPLTWEWNFGDGSPLSFIQNPVHVFPALGPYNVRLIVTNGGCADTITQTVTAVNENPDFSASSTTACRIANITFTAQNINTANIASYAWDFGDGNNVIVSTPSYTHTYTTPGTYTVTLVTTDINGCTDQVIKTNYIRINGPTADFTATNVAGCSNLITTFNDLSTTDGVNALTSWQWDFGDGVVQTFTAPPFQHTYTTTGTFTVKLIVTDAAGCRDSTIRLSLVTTTDPVPNFVVDTLSCPGAVLTFTNTSTPAGVSSQWFFGDGNSSAATSPTHSYAAPGRYTIRLIITDAFGCIDSIVRPNYIRVDTPDANFTINDSISSCIPLEIQFTNTSTFYSSVVWDFGPGQGNSTLINPIHFYSVPGVYPVKLIVTSPGGCLDSLIRTITVYDTAGSRIDYLPVSGCKPLPVTLNLITPGPMVSYFWDFGDGNTQVTTTPNANHTYTSFGNFLPKVIMEDPSGCIIPIQGIDTVYVTGSETNFGEDTTVFCDFGTVQFTDSTTFNDPIIRYSWSFGDGGTSSLQNPVHQYTSPGLYDVQLITETQFGCLDTLLKPALIRVVESPLIDITGDTVICIYDSILHAGIFIRPDTSVVTWSWTFPNGNTSTLQNPPIQTYSTAGSFTVTAVATNSTGCKDTTTQNILINPLPVITIPNQMTIINGYPDTIPATYSPNTISWIWSPATGLSCADCPNPIAGPRVTTFYQVFFTDNNSCSNTGSILVNVICQNSNLFIPNTFSPNGDGSNDVFYPRGRGLERVRVLRIFNRWGEVVFERRDFPVNDATMGWNGTFKGKRPMADVYIYQAEVFCENGDIIKLNGNISLIL
jgi:gliding motility-associated-like protein